MSDNPIQQAEKLHVQPVKLLLEQVFNECDKIAEAEAAAGSTRRITSILQKLSLIYYLDVRKQAMLAFWSAFGAAVAGILFFFYAIWRSMSPGETESARFSLWAGGLTQFISAVSFVLYFRVARQFATFHVCLERMNRFLLANTMCDSLDEKTRADVRASLVEIIACAPMLTLDPASVAAEEPSPVWPKREKPAEGATSG